MNDMNTTIVSINSNTILYSTAEQTDILSFVETFLVNSPNFSRPCPRTPLRSRQLGRVSRIDQLRKHNRIRERAAKTRFVAARTNTRKAGHAQLLEALRIYRLSKPAEGQAIAKLGVLDINGGKPLLSKTRKDIVGFPGLFDADHQTELTEDDRFLGPMKRAIINRNVTSFNKLGSYMAQFWTKAAVVNNCVIIDNKLAIPKHLRKAILARLHRSHLGQEAIVRLRIHLVAIHSAKALRLVRTLTH